MKNLKHIIIGIALVFVSVFTNAQTVYTVTKTTDPDPFEHSYNFEDSLCDPEMYGTLRWAIRKVNETYGPRVINFNITGTGPHTILLNNFLPQITKDVIIDGTSQPGYTGENPVITIDGQNLISWCFNAYSLNSLEISGLDFIGFVKNGITLRECYNVIIKSNNIALKNSNYDSYLKKGYFARITAYNCENIGFYNNILNTTFENIPTPGPYNYGIMLTNTTNCNIGSTEQNFSNKIVDCYNALYLDSSQNIRISANEIFNNVNGILLEYGSNNSKKKPMILSYDEGVIRGVAEIGDIIEVFGSTGGENANEFLGTVQANENGNWSLTATTSYDYLIATATDQNNNTSMYSDEILVSPTCAKPTNLSSTEGISTSHTLTWDGTTGVTYNVAVGVKGLSPLDENWVVGYNTNYADNQITISGLDENTVYEFYVSTNCVDEVSHWAGQVEFNVHCSNTKILTNPYVYIGDTIALETSSLPAENNSWMSSNTNIAKINDDGTLIALNSGTTLVTFTDINNCQVNVIFTILNDLSEDNFTDDESLYYSDRVYLRTKIDYNIDLGSDSTFITEYKITKISKPFAGEYSERQNRTYRIIFNSEVEIENTLISMGDLSFVEFVEKIPINRVFEFIPDDGDVYSDEDVYLELINAYEACEIYQSVVGLNAAKVAIVDDAIMISHEDLIGNISSSDHCDATDIYIIDNVLYSPNTDPNPPFSGTHYANGDRFSHGTHVAGIAGAVTNNGIGVSSAGWNNELLCVKTGEIVTNSHGELVVELTSCYDGVRWAAENGAKVINMSWGSRFYSQEEYDLLVDLHNEFDVVFVAGAGNGYTYQAFYPAAYGELTTGESWEEQDVSLIIAVAALDDNSDIADWGHNTIGNPSGSNFGYWVDISAYGDQIFSTIAKSNWIQNTPITDQYASYDGTSMSAPMVSSVAGLLRSYKPDANADDIYNCLIYSANQDIYDSNLHPDNQIGTLGFGRLDAEAAIRCLSSNCVPDPVAIIVPSESVLCPESTITLTASDGAYYIWSNGAESQSIDVELAGEYCVTVFYDGGCKSVACFTLENAILNPHVDVIETSGLESFDGIVCYPYWINLVASEGMGYNWDGPWENNGSSFTSGLFSPIGGEHSLPFTSTYCVDILGVSGCPNFNSYVCADVTYLKSPIANAGPDQTVCVGSPIQLTGQPDGLVSYLWTKDYYFFSDQQSPTVTISATSYDEAYYRLSCTDDNGCVNSIETGTEEYMDRVMHVEVIDPEDNDIFIYAPTTLCNNSSVLCIDVNPTGGTWTGIGIVNNCFDPSIAGLGTHNLTYTIAVGSECENSETIEITVVEGTDIVFNIPDVYCDDSGLYPVHAIPDGGTWTWNGLSTGVINTGNHGPGEVTYLYSYSNGVCISNEEFTYTILDVPKITNVRDVCIIEDAFQLIGYPVGGTFWIDDEAIIDGIVNAADYGIGEHSLFYSIESNGTTCWSDEYTFNILDYYEDITIPEYGPVCSTDLVLLTAYPLGGVWSGPGIIDNYIYGQCFSAQIAGSGSHTIRYTYALNTSCEIFEEITINVEHHTFTQSSNVNCVDGSLEGSFSLNILPGISGHIEVYFPNSGYTWIFDSENFTGFTYGIIPSEDQSLEISIITNNGCEYNYFFNPDIPTCPQFDISVNPATCYDNPNHNIVLELLDGDPPYEVTILQYNTQIIEEYIFESDGIYELDFPLGYDPESSLQIIINDEVSYYESNVVVIDEMPDIWAVENILTSDNIHNQSVYNDEIVCIGTELDQTLNITQDVTFTNCTIYCATHSYTVSDETQWTVNNGATLTLDNTTITSGCPDQLWQGIAINGDTDFQGSLPNTLPGQFIMKNNSKIEFAKAGVIGLHNAVVKITDSKFYNCYRSVFLAFYNESFIASSMLSNIKPRAYISRSSFITDENFIQAPLENVNLWGIDKITLKGNKFINSTPTSMLSGTERGKGIYALNSTFSVIENQGLFNPPDFNILPQNKSVFEGLYYGVYAKTTSANTATIRNCDFKNYGYMGVYLQNVITPKVTSNTFNKEQFGVMTKNVGLYLKSCTGYNIENNTFNEGGYGMIVNNSGPNANKVYRNHFNSPYQGLHAYFTNSNTDGSLGLFVQCNDYHNNNGVQNFIKEGNVKKQQGYYDDEDPEESESAANQFEITNLVDESESAFRISWEYGFNDYKYWCNEFDDLITDITGYTSSTVTVDETGFLLDLSKQCPSKLGHIAIDYEREIARKKSDISSLNDNMDEIVDGGSTAQVLQKVQNLNPNNFNKTSNELLNLSPYLSDTVLVTFMQTGVNGHIVAKTNVLAANSPLPPHALAELENMDLPAPHKNYLAQMQTGTNAVVLLKEEIGNIEFNKNLYINEYISYGLNNDSIPMVKDSVVNFLMNDDYFESKCMVIPILISDARYVDAQTQINELDYLASNQNPVLQAELSEFADLQELIIQTDTTTSSESLLDVVENNLTMLESMAYNPSHRGSSVAQILLSEAGIAEFEPEIFLPMDDRSMRFSIAEEAITDNFDLNDMIEVYPTPASSEIWIEYLLIDTKPVSKIDIYDVEGKLVLSQSIRNGYGLERVDVSQLSEGNYVLKMGDFSKQISVMK